MTMFSFFVSFKKSLTELQYFAVLQNALSDTYHVEICTVPLDVKEICYYLTPCELQVNVPFAYKPVS